MSSESPGNSSGFTTYAEIEHKLKQRFCDEAWQEQLGRPEAKWRKKTRSIQDGGVITPLRPVTIQ